MNDFKLGDTTVICTYGIPKDVNVIDATCPFCEEERTRKEHIALVDA